MSKYSNELENTYGTIGNLKRLTIEKKRQFKINKEIKMASRNITKILGRR